MKQSILKFGQLCFCDINIISAINLKKSPIFILESQHSHMFSRYEFFLFSIDFFSNISSSLEHAQISESL